jgi:SAM-dependent methyltransferase
LILNIGCGRYPLEGALNHDKEKYYDHVDVTHDLNEYPWPWASGWFDEVWAVGVMEHLKEFMQSLEECHRILILGGRMNMSVPSASVITSFDDPTHRWFFTPRSMDYFIEGTSHGDTFGFYSRMRWKKISCEVVGADIRFILEKLPCAEHFS